MLLQLNTYKELCDVVRKYVHPDVADRKWGSYFVHPKGSSRHYRRVPLNMQKDGLLQDVQLEQFPLTIALSMLTNEPLSKHFWTKARNQMDKELLDAVEVLGNEEAEFLQTFEQTKIANRGFCFVRICKDGEELRSVLETLFYQARNSRNLISELYSYLDLKG